MEAIYLITPSKDSVKALIADFNWKNRTHYRTAHVYFTEACPDSLFDELASSLDIDKIRTFYEIYMSFVPIERRVFSLDHPEAFQMHFNPKVSDEMESMAEQLATLCYTLGEYPSIRYRA